MQICKYFSVTSTLKELRDRLVVKQVAHVAMESKFNIKEGGKYKLTNFYSYTGLVPVH